MASIESAKQDAQHGDMDTIVMLFPASSRSSKVTAAYGSYDLPEQVLHLDRRQQVEEPMSLAVSHTAAARPDSQSTPPQSPSDNHTLAKVPRMCYTTLQACESATNKCSGHGTCYKKYGSDDKSNCYTCGCSSTRVQNDDKTFKTTYWGGAACSKVDVSAPFWLLAGFTVVLMGLVSWAIGMMFSVGEEKLPGVIGAGVSGPKR